MERHITVTLIANEFIVRHSIMAHITGISEELGSAGPIRPMWRGVATHSDVGTLRCQHLLIWLEQELWYWETGSLGSAYASALILESLEPKIQSPQGCTSFWSQVL